MSQQAGFSAVEAILLLVVLGIIGGTGWFVYHSKQVADKLLQPVTSSAQQSSTLKSTSSPASATSKVPTPPATITTPATTTAPVSTSGYLTITEWGVKLPTTANTQDASYTAVGSEMHITTTTLTNLAKKIPGCSSHINDVYLTRSTTAPSATTTSVHIGSYYYRRANTIEPDCVSQQTADNADVIAQINVIQQDLISSLGKVVAQ